MASAVTRPFSYTRYTGEVWYGIGRVWCGVEWFGKVWLFYLIIFICHRVKVPQH